MGERAEAAWHIRYTHSMRQLPGGYAVGSGAMGSVHEVKAAGVRGACRTAGDAGSEWAQQPRRGPASAMACSRWCQLSCPYGTWHGVSDGVAAWARARYVVSVQ